jgi:MYXO-CTERM domain-containing protein
MRTARLVSFVVVGLLVVLAESPASAALLHDEGVDGDLSGDGLNPAHFDLSLGANSIIATSVSGDREYVNLTVPAGLELSAVNLVSYQGLDGTAFIAVQQGATFTESHIGTDVANLFGWSHFGPGVGNLGTDILDDIGQGPGAIGFTPPLSSGEYTWWMQQTGGNAATYQFDFVVTPEPAALVLAALGLALVARRRRAARR